MRTYYYVRMATVTDNEAAQKKGMCCVVGFDPEFKFNSDGFTVLRRAGYILKRLPCRNACTHVCYNEDPRMEMFVQMYRRATDKNIWLRVRPHVGTF